jgi:DMSO/TMAO reductase YedYZ molybdopterin-dependent catalytic subunit
MPELARRRFLVQAGAFLGAAVVAGSVGRLMAERPAAAPPVTGGGLPPVASGLPAAANPVPTLTADQSLSAPGLTPIVTPINDFFRIDLALEVPRIDTATWQLKVTGMVDRPLTLTYQDLLDRPLVEQYVTIACVSNPIGGDLIGNALWTGVRLKEILAEAGVQSGATQIVGRSVDGFTAGFPTEWALEPSRESLIALGMNRQPLPAPNGYPARLVVPGLFGYVCDTKWLSEIELTTWEGFNGYWVPLGWAKSAPVLTQTRIDTPTRGASVPAGQVDIAGVAWAPDRGITGVEVRIDDGPWQPATLSRELSKASWVQWLLPWQATSGVHSIEARATDGTGTVQAEQRSGVMPDGARGYHRVEVQVT